MRKIVILLLIMFGLILVGCQKKFDKLFNEGKYSEAYACAKTDEERHKAIDELINEKSLTKAYSIVNSKDLDYFYDKLVNNKIFTTLSKKDTGIDDTRKEYNFLSVHVKRAVEAYLNKFKTSYLETTKQNKKNALNNIHKIWVIYKFSDYRDDYGTTKEAKNDVYGLMSVLEHGGAIRFLIENKQHKTYEITVNSDAKDVCEEIMTWDSQDHTMRTHGNYFTTRFPYYILIDEVIKPFWVSKLLESISDSLN